MHRFDWSRLPLNCDCRRVRFFTMLEACARMNATATLKMVALPASTLGSLRTSATRNVLRFQVPVELRSLRVVCNASSAVSFTEKFDAAQQEQWQSSRHLVEELGFNGDEADDILAKSFGWSYSDYWGEEKQASVPDPASVSASLSLMQSLGVDMVALVKKFPEVMGLTEKEIQYSLGTLDGTWGIAGKNLKSVLLRNPQVLGYNIDCGGDCAGECTRCWVRF